MRTFGAVIALVLVVLWAPSVQAEGRVFFDDFESQSFTDAHWLTDTFGTGRTRCPIVSVASDGVIGPFAGTKMLSCNTTSVQNTQPDFDTLGLDYIPLHNQEFFIRAKTRIDADMFKTASSAKKIMRFFVNSIDFDWFHIIRTAPGLAENVYMNGAYLEVYFGSTPVGNQNPPPISPPDTTSSGITTWHTVEYYVHRGTRTFKVWHDDKLIRHEVGTASWPNNNYMGSRLQLMSNFADLSGTGDNLNHMYIDNFEMYSDLGTGGVGSMINGDITQGGGDITPPSAPTNLRITFLSYNLAQITWDSSTDDTAVTGYLVEHCSGVSCSSFAQVGTPSVLSYNDTGLLVSTSYSWRVRATDAANNLSSYSSTLTTLTDTVKFHPTMNLRRIHYGYLSQEGSYEDPMSRPFLARLF